MQETKRIDEILTEANWFQLDWTPNGVNRNPTTRRGHCLATVLAEMGLWRDYHCCLKRIIIETFPERVSDTSYIIQTFNNHKETVWQDVEKIMREFEWQKELMEK